MRALLGAFRLRGFAAVATFEPPFPTKNPQYCGSTRTMASRRLWEYRTWTTLRSHNGIYDIFLYIRAVPDDSNNIIGVVPDLFEMLQENGQRIETAKDLNRDLGKGTVHY